MASRKRKGRPRFKRHQKATDPNGFFRQAEAKYDPQRRHLYVNKSAAKIIERAIAPLTPETKAPSLGGVMIGGLESAMVARNLKAFVKAEADPEVREAVQHVADEFSLAHGSYGIVTIINADSCVPIAEVRKTEREEEAHRVVTEAAGGNFSPRFITRIASDIAFTPTLRRMHHLRPDITTEIQAVNELSAVLMLGGWEDIGVSDDGAGSLWYSFAKLLIEYHGDQAKAILKHGHPLHAQKVARRIRRELGIPPNRKQTRGDRGDKTRG